MPVYAYACRDCGHAFDIRQSFSDDALTVCPECGGQLRKKFNSVGVVFKGSGFYRTDSRSESSSGSGPGGKTSSAGDTPATTSGSDTGGSAPGSGGTSSGAGSAGAKGTGSAGSGTAAAGSGQ